MTAVTTVLSTPAKKKIYKRYKGLEVLRNRNFYIGPLLTGVRNWKKIMRTGETKEEAVEQDEKMDYLQLIQKDYVRP